MKIQTRVVDKDSNKTFNFVLDCTDADFQAGRELAPDYMEQVDVLVKINGESYEFTNKEFKRAIVTYANKLWLDKIDTAYGT